MTIDDRFRRAVAAIDAGDVAQLERVIESDPAIVCERLETPGAWLRDTVGRALDDFFKAPYLLWFVAEDPVRKGFCRRTSPMSLARSFAPPAAHAPTPFSSRSTTR